MEVVGEKIVEFGQRVVESEYYKSTKLFCDQSMTKVQETLKPIFDSEPFQQGKEFCKRTLLKHWLEPISTSANGNPGWYIQQERSNSAESELIEEYLCERATKDRYKNEARSQVAWKTLSVAFMNLCFSPAMFVCNFGKGIYEGTPVAWKIGQEYRKESRKQGFEKKEFFQTRVEQLKPAGRYLLHSGIDFFAAYLFRYYSLYMIGAISVYCFYNPLQARVTINAAERLWHSQADKINCRDLGPWTFLKLFSQGSLLLSDYLELRKINEGEDTKKTD